jgi:hypothetical protein
MSSNDAGNSADIGSGNAARQEALPVHNGCFRALYGSPDVPPPLAKAAQQ